LVFALVTFSLPAQTVYEYKRSDADVFFFDKGLSQDIPHIIRNYEEGKAIHNEIWHIDTVGKAALQPPMMMVSDWNDDGGGGAGSIPKNVILIDMAPINMSYFINPVSERYHTLFRHEYTHSVMSDKTSANDRFWRTVLGGKFNVEPLHPFSAIWSYLAAPRWYVPRWYQEGIATFMETWLNGGVGRSLGGYDEMYFRSVVYSGEDLYSVVGLETGGSVSDFQGGVNSYLYGTRFVNYLEYQYGLDKLLAWYNRTDDSKKIITGQFKSIYGNSLRNVWDEWRDFEVQHQRRQIKKLEEYPITPTEPLTEKAMGSMSPLAIDRENNCAYAAVSYPGDFAHIERIDLNDLSRRKLYNVDGAQNFQTCYLTLDTKDQRLIWTTQNSKMRGLRVYDLKKGKIVKKLNYQRTYCIVYDNANDCMYGIMTSRGRHYIVRYDSDLENRQVLFSFPFGVSAFDMDVSHDGKKLTVTTSGDNGQQKLLCFDTEGLQNADFSYKTLYSADDFNLGQFRFTPDDRKMVGSSYYTGVSNVWSLDLETEEFSLLSNTRTGFFSPELINDTTMVALEFERNGMRPVIFRPEVLNDVNAVEMLGQKAYEAHPEELEALGQIKGNVREVTFGEVVDSIKVYNPLKNLKFSGAYPEISGFRDKQSWNNVTPVLGYRFIFSDPLGLNSLKFSVGLSPWSHNDAVNQYHAQLEWKYWNWTLNASWNPTSFYDLAGPMQSSRKGWMISLGYEKKKTTLTPVTQVYGAKIAAYGMMDALPMYQEIETGDITSFQTADVYYKYSKTRKTRGAVMPEQGIETGAECYAYLADGKFFPTLNATCDVGFLIPVMKNTCLWLRSAVGQNFGDATSVFGNEYFGGFGNNWIDYREANRYRDVNRFAGKKIDAIEAHSYARLMAELSLRPIRYNNFGLVNLFPTYSQFSIFSTGLIANPWGNINTKGYVNVGIQLNTEVVMFKSMKTTWSIGYARAFNPDGTSEGDWLISLKLL